MVRINNDPREAKMLDAIEKARADEQSREYWARRNGREEGIAHLAANLLKDGMPIERVAAGAGLSVSELEELLQRVAVGVPA